MSLPFPSPSLPFSSPAQTSHDLGFEIAPSSATQDEYEVMEPLPSILLPEYSTLHTVEFLQPLATSEVDSMRQNSGAELVHTLTSPQISLQPSSEYFTNSSTPTVSDIEVATIAEKLSTSLFVPFLLPMPSLGVDRVSSTELSILSPSQPFQTYNVQTPRTSASKVFDSSQTLMSVIAADATSSVLYLMLTSVAEGFKRSQTGFPISQSVQSTSLDRQFAYTSTTTIVATTASVKVRRSSVELLEPFSSNSQFAVFSISVTTKSGLATSDISYNSILQPMPSMLLSTEQIVSSAIESTSTSNEFSTSTIYPSETMPLETLPNSEDVLFSFTETQKANSTLIELSSTEDGNISRRSLADNPELMPQSFSLESTTVFFDKTGSYSLLTEQSPIFSRILTPTDTFVSSPYPSSSGGSATASVMSFSTGTPLPTPSPVLLSEDVFPTEKESAVEILASQTTTIQLQSETESVFMNEEIFPSPTLYVFPNISSSLPRSEQLTSPNDFVSNTFNSDTSLLINSTNDVLVTDSMSYIFMQTLTPSINSESITSTSSSLMPAFTASTLAFHSLIPTAVLLSESASNPSTVNLQVPATVSDYFQLEFSLETLSVDSISSGFDSISLSPSQSRIEVRPTTEEIFSPSLLVLPTPYSSEQVPDATTFFVTTSSLSNTENRSTSPLSSLNDELLLPESISDAFVGTSISIPFDSESFAFISPTSAFISKLTSFFSLPSHTVTSNLPSSSPHVRESESSYLDTPFPESTSDAYSSLFMVPSQSQSELQFIATIEEIFPTPSLPVFSTPSTSVLGKEQPTSSPNTSLVSRTTDNSSPILARSGSKSDRFIETSTPTLVSESLILVPSLTSFISTLTNMTFTPQSTSGFFSDSSSERPTIHSGALATESVSFIPKTSVSIDITNFISEGFFSPSVTSSQSHIEILSTAEEIFISPSILVFPTTSSDQESEIPRSSIGITPLSSTSSSRSSTLASSNDDLLFPESTSDTFIERSTHTTLEYESFISPSPTGFIISELTSFFTTPSFTLKEIAESTSNILNSTPHVTVFRSPRLETTFTESTSDAFTSPFLAPSESQYVLQSTSNNEDIFPSSSQFMSPTPFSSDPRREQPVSPTDTTDSLTSSDDIVTFSGSASDRFGEVSTLPPTSESFFLVPSITEGIFPIFSANMSFTPQSTSALFSDGISESSTVISSAPVTDSDSFIPKTSLSTDITEFTSEGFVSPSLAPSHSQTEVPSAAEEMLQSTSLLVSPISYSSEQEQELPTSIDNTPPSSTTSHGTSELISSSDDLLSPESTSDEIIETSVHAPFQSESFIHPSPTGVILDFTTFFQVPLSTLTEIAERISSTPSSTPPLTDFEFLHPETTIHESTSGAFIQPSPIPSESHSRLEFTSVAEKIFTSPSPPVFLAPSTSELELEELTSTIDTSAVFISTDIDRSILRSSTDFVAFSGSISSRFSITPEVLLNTEEILTFPTQSPPVFFPTPPYLPEKPISSPIKFILSIYPNISTLITLTSPSPSLYSDFAPGSATILPEFPRSLLMPETQSSSHFPTTPTPTPTPACSQYVLEIVPPYFFLIKLTLEVTEKEYETLRVSGSKERCSLEMALTNLFETGLREDILVKREVTEYDENNTLKRRKRSNEATMFNEDHGHWKRQAENEEYSATVSI